MTSDQRILTTPIAMARRPRNITPERAIWRVNSAQRDAAPGTTDVPFCAPGGGDLVRVRCARSASVCRRDLSAAGFSVARSRPVSCVAGEPGLPASMRLGVPAEAYHPARSRGVVRRMLWQAGRR